MDIGETLYVTRRAAWRAWLAAHHEDRHEIWLVSYRVRFEQPSLPYNDAVEEALCFGWIDSIRKSLDEQRLVQRYTPRRPGSAYSRINLERVARLTDQGRIIPSVLATLGDLRADDFRIPDDVLAALQADAAAWAFFSNTSPSYQRIRAAHVDDARGNPAEFDRRLVRLVAMSARRKQFGYQIEAYY